MVASFGVEDEAKPRRLWRQHGPDRSLRPLCLRPQLVTRKIKDLMTVDTRAPFETLCPGVLLYSALRILATRRFLSPVCVEIQCSAHGVFQARQRQELIWRVRIASP